MPRPEVASIARTVLASPTPSLASVGFDEFSILLLAVLRAPVELMELMVVS